MADPVKIDYVADWRKRLRGRLFTQFRNKTTWEGWVQLLGRQAQDLEDAAQSLLTLWDIDNSHGVNLDRIGRAIGQKRLGVDDATYRLYLRARVLANKSTGTPEDLFSLMRALFGSSAAPRYWSGYVKAFAINISGAILTRTQALVALSFLRDAKEAGAGGILEWAESADADLMHFDAARSIGLDQIDAGVPFSSITIDGDGDDFLLWDPQGGTVVIEPGTVREESFTYQGVTFSNQTLDFSSPQVPAFTHNSFEYYCQAVASPVPVVGNGFDEGVLAGALRA